MIYFLAILWYLVGSVGGLFLLTKITRKITYRDLVFLFTIGGLGGLLTVLVALTHLPRSKNNWWDKDAF